MINVASQPPDQKSTARPARATTALVSSRSSIGRSDACSMASARSPRPRSPSEGGAPARTQRCTGVNAPLRDQRRRRPTQTEYAEEQPNPRRRTTFSEVTESNGEEHGARESERGVEHSQQSGAGLVRDLADGYWCHRGHRPMLMRYAKTYRGSSRCANIFAGPLSQSRSALVARQSSSL